mgnify:CR=1 FL=1
MIEGNFRAGRYLKLSWYNGWCLVFQTVEHRLLDLRSTCGSERQVAESTCTDITEFGVRTCADDSHNRCMFTHPAQTTAVLLQLLHVFSADADYDELDLVMVS